MTTILKVWSFNHLKLKIYNKYALRVYHLSFCTFFQALLIHWLNSFKNYHIIRSITNYLKLTQGYIILNLYHPVNHVWTKMFWINFRPNYDTWAFFHKKDNITSKHPWSYIQHYLFKYRKFWLIHIYVWVI